MDKDSFRYIYIRTEPREGSNKCYKNYYGIFHGKRLLVFKKGNAKQINKNIKVSEMMIGRYEKATGLKLEVRHIPVMFT